VTRAAGLALACALSLAARGAPAAGFDSALLSELLARHTREVADTAGVRVDYRGVAADPAWPRLLASLAEADPDALADRAERLALWINAYNALAIDLVARRPGVASIRDLGSWLRPVWDREAGRVGGRPRSLGEIEHAILRPLGEPRIHAAIVCASVSCPPLRREPYDAARLDAQLDDQMRRFLASPEKGLRIDEAARSVWLSRVFDWFEEDFAAAGGALAFASRFAPEPARRWLAAHPDARLRWLPYDWSLNSLAAADARR
jgi:hypothetical protein